MNHTEAVELIEIAAAEPDGLERLAAGDTSESIALIGHVAGCVACSAEFETLRRVAAATRAALADEPGAELRERTLAYVAALGRDRPGSGADAVPSDRAAGGTEEGSSMPGMAGAGVGAATRPPLPSVPAGTAGSRPDAGRWSRLSWRGLAAAVVLAALAGGLIVGSIQELSLERETASLYSLARVSEEALQIGAAPDAITVALADPAGAAAVGSLVFSGESGELAVMATGLAVPADGWEYRCWVETAGVRHQVGKMTLGEGLAFWAGPSEGLATAGPGTIFGVSLVERDAPGGGDPVLLGQIPPGDS